MRARRDATNGIPALDAGARKSEHVIASAAVRRMVHEAMDDTDERHARGSERVADGRTTTSRIPPHQAVL